MGETPLPIPNRAVKPHSADGTWPSRAWESRSPPFLHRAAPGRLELVNGPCSISSSSTATACSWTASESRYASTLESWASCRDAFNAELEAIDGVVEALDAIELSACVASSSSHERLRHTLGLTGLFDRFRGRIFSAEDVEHGKPAPDLFLHAAAALGADPTRCAVVEDSPFGLEAARAAGMRAFAYAAHRPPPRPGNHHLRRHARAAGSPRPAPLGSRGRRARVGAPGARGVDGRVRAPGARGVDGRVRAPGACGVDGRVRAPGTSVRRPGRAS